LDIEQELPVCLLNRIAAVVALFVIIAGARAGDSPPPTTAPVTFTIHGTIKAAANLDLQKIDLTRAVVYLDSDPVLDAYPFAPTHPYVAQQNKAFVPNFLAIAKNTPVEFPNWDHFSHNVFSRSAAAPAFDLERYPYGQSKTRIFDKSGVIQVFCNIHPFMKAIIFVAPNGFFTRPDAQGRFEITGIPAGKYQLFAWQERCGDQHQTVTVGPDEANEIDFTLDENRQSILANDPPSHTKTYGGVERGLGLKREQLNLPVVQESHPASTTAPAAQ
jgi:plastocyanin